MSWEWQLTDKISWDAVGMFKKMQKWLGELKMSRTELEDVRPGGNLE